ncbi:MAG: glycosyltransferase family 39 protein [Thermomicrobiales bacterium]
MIRGISRGAARLARAIRPLPRFLVALIAVALVIRIAAAILLNFVIFASGGDFFTRGDEVAYDTVAWQQAQVWHGERAAVDADRRFLLNAFTYSGAAIYFVIGHHVFAVILLNCLVGALAVGLIAASAYQFFGPVAAYVSGIAVAIFPTTILMSGLNMKDPLFFLFVAAFVWLTTRLVQTRRARLLLPLLLALALIGNMRLYLLLLIIPLAPLAILLALRDTARRRWSLALGMIAGGLLLFLVGGGANFLARQVPRLNQQRFYVSSFANSGFVPTPEPTATTADPATPAPAGNSSRGDDYLSLARWLPTGILYALAAPFPWAATRTIERLVIPEMLLWYLLLALALLGLFQQRHRWRSYLFLLGYIAGIVVIFAISHGNYGGLVRQRATMLAPFVCIFSGAGASYLWAQWLRRQGRTASEDSSTPTREAQATGQLTQERAD